MQMQGSVIVDLPAKMRNDATANHLVPPLRGMLIVNFHTTVADTEWASFRVDFQGGVDKKQGRDVMCHVRSFRDVM